MAEGREFEPVGEFTSIIGISERFPALKVMSSILKRTVWVLSSLEVRAPITWTQLFLVGIAIFFQRGLVSKKDLKINNELIKAGASFVFTPRITHVNELV